MGHLDYLTNLLDPLGVYDLTSKFNRGELIAIAGVLDGVMAEVEELEQEMSLATASDWGVTQIGDLLSVSPVASSKTELAVALATLLRIGGDSSTLEAINDTVNGCGINALVTELDDPNYVQVEFPDVKGIPEGYDEIKTIIDGILPAQVNATYYFWYQDWEALESMDWAGAENGYTWYTLATGEK